MISRLKSEPLKSLLDANKAKSWLFELKTDRLLGFEHRLLCLDLIFLTFGGGIWILDKGFDRLVEIINKHNQYD